MTPTGFLKILMQYRYWALFPLACFEGPIISFLVGFMVYAGYVNFIPSYIILIFGDIVPDTIYYYIGRAGKEKDLVEKYSKKFSAVASNFGILEKLWIDHPRKTMFLSKLAYGFSIPFLISAGLVKMPFRKFMEYTIPVTLFQYGFLMAIGFYLGKSFELATKYVQYGGYIIGGIFVLFIVAYIYTIKRARRQIIEMEKKEETL